MSTIICPHCDREIHQKPRRAWQTQRRFEAELSPVPGQRGGFVVTDTREDETILQHTRPDNISDQMLDTGLGFMVGAIVGGVVGALVDYGAAQLVYIADPIFTIGGTLAGGALGGGFIVWLRCVDIETKKRIAELIENAKPKSQEQTVVNLMAVEYPQEMPQGYHVNVIGELSISTPKFIEWAKAALTGDKLTFKRWAKGKDTLFSEPEYKRFIDQLNKSRPAIVRAEGKETILTPAGKRVLLYALNRLGENDLPMINGQGVN